MRRSRSLRQHGCREKAADAGLSHGQFETHHNPSKEATSEHPMGSTLQEQFLKMGLVKKSQADKVKKAKHQQKISRSGEAADAIASKSQAQQALAEKKDRALRLNEAKKEEAREQESAARIRQLIEAHRLTVQEGATPYNFTDDRKIKRLYLPGDVADRLSSGILAIVRLAGDYQIVPAEIAEKVRLFNSNLVVVHHTPQPTAIDDSYADAEYQVPDDLMW